MINRGREIIKMMGYDDSEAFLEAVGRGDVIAIKVPAQHLGQISKWLHARLGEAADSDAPLAEALHDIADGLEMALELEHYPGNADICDINLPHGWPSYCARK